MAQPLPSKNNRSFTTPAKNGDWIAILLKESKPLKTVEESKSESGESFEVTPEGLKRFQPGAKSGKKEKATEKKSKAPTSSASESEEKETEPKVDKKKEKENGTTLILRNLKSGIEQRFPNVVEFLFDENGTTLAFATSATQAEDDGVWVVELKSGDQKKVVSGKGNFKQLAFNKTR